MLSYYQLPPARPLYEESPREKPLRRIKNVSIAAIASLLLTAIALGACGPWFAFLAAHPTGGQAVVDGPFLTAFFLDVAFAWVLVIAGIASLCSLIAVAWLAAKIRGESLRKDMRTVFALAVAGIFVPVVLGVAAAALAIDRARKELASLRGGRTDQPSDLAA